jgi:FkbM family methyltransferase
MQTFRQPIQASLERVGVYQRLRASRVSDLYWNIADKGRIDARHKMWIDRAGSSLNTLSHKWVETLKGDKTRFKHTNSSLEFAQHRVIETTTLEDLIVAHGLPFFIKIDVEGYEANVVKGLKYRVPLLSFEANLPEFRPEALECVELLERLSADGKFNYAAEGRQTLSLETWLDAGAFSEELEKCSLNTIEIFCKNCISN